MKPISYKQEMGDMERICTWEAPTGSFSISLSSKNLQIINAGEIVKKR